LQGVYTAASNGDIGSLEFILEESFFVA